ncbi:MAG: hypothetical protein ACKPHU_26740, partial [Planctomycetaceae bacterium]
EQIHSTKSCGTRRSAEALSHWNAEPDLLTPQRFAPQDLRMDQKKGLNQFGSGPACYIGRYFKGVPFTRLRTRSAAR